MYVLLVLAVNYIGFFLIIGTAMVPTYQDDSRMEIFIKKGLMLLVIFTVLSAVVAFLSFIFRYEMGYHGKAIWKVAIGQMIFFILIVAVLIAMSRY